MNLKLPVYAPALILLCLNLTGCAVVKGVFKAGMWVGVLSVLAIVGLIVFGLNRVRR